MRTIYLSTKQKYQVNDEQAALAAKAMTTGGVLHLKDQGVVIKGSAIMEIGENQPVGLPEHATLPEGQYWDRREVSGVQDLPDPDPTTHQRQREQMAKIREDLGKKLRWPKRG